MADDVALTSTPDTTGGNPIDVTTVVTAAGTVKRERVSLGAADLDRDVTVTAGGALLVDPGGATQPVSAASLPLPAGAATEATLALIKAKTDNLDVALSTRTKPADTQTVSGSVSVSNLPATQPVSAAALPLPAGASTEATLALIKAKTDNLDVALSTRTKPADTQTVSGSVSVSNFPAVQPVSDNGGSLTVDNGAFSQTGGGTEAGVMRVTLASDSTGLVSVDDNGGSLTVDGSVSVSNFPATQPVSAASLPLPAGAATEATLAAVKAKTDLLLASAKGVQTATALGVQDFKDAGRVIKCYSGFKFTPATTEALVTLTPVSDGTAGSTGTSFTVTSGKRLRLQAMSVTIHASSTTSVGVMVSLRMSASGAVTASSPLVATIGAGLVGTQVAHCATSNQITFPDGLELSGTMQFGISQIGIATADATVTLVAFEY